jgi:hypothetical protein
LGYYDTIFENAEPLIFNGLGESLTYYPVDGEPRSIVCPVTRSTETQVGGNGIDEMEVAEICALNDAETGIAYGTWEIGDRIRFADDPEDEFYSYRSNHSHCPSSGWLVFQKKVNVRMGGNFGGK